MESTKKRKKREVHLVLLYNDNTPQDIKEQLKALYPEPLEGQELHLLGRRID